jgi:hypothetical protein
MRYLGFRRATPLDLIELGAWLAERALEHDKEMHLLRTLLDRLRWSSILRPGLSILERLVTSARQRAREVTFEHLSFLLTDEHKAFLDSLLVVTEGERLTPHGRLQQLPTEANAAQINEALAKITFLKESGVADWDLSLLNPNRLKVLAAKGQRSSNQSLQRTAELQRYPILIAFLKQSLLTLTDAVLDLLGLSFTPRIKDLQDLQLYRTEELILDELPKVRARLSKRLRTQLVLDMWDEMLRFAGSLKLGYVSASLVIQKLQAAPRKSRLARALQEYGRLIKTIHVLGWYESQKKRRWVTRQLNKGEAIHSLKSFLTVGNKGVLRRKTDEGLQNQLLCLNLLTNCVIVWNTVYMTRVLEQLEVEGYEFDRHDLKHVWPTRAEHVNMAGKYFFNIEQTTTLRGLRPLRQPSDLNP